MKFYDKLYTVGYQSVDVLYSFNCSFEYLLVLSTIFHSYNRLSIS